MDLRQFLGVLIHGAWSLTVVATVLVVGPWVVQPAAAKATGEPALFEARERHDAVGPVGLVALDESDEAGRAALLAIAMEPTVPVHVYDAAVGSLVDASTPVVPEIAFHQFSTGVGGSTWVAAEATGPLFDDGAVVSLVAPSAPGRQLPFNDPDRVRGINKVPDGIDSGRPLPYRQDGTVFRNAEGRLPQQSLGYNREYTVPTPGAANRGTGRLLIGRNGEIYYTDDHYGSFTQIDPREHP